MISICLIPLQALANKPVKRVIHLEGPTPAHKLVLSVLDPILEKHVTVPGIMHDYDYFDQELSLITKTGLQGFVDCVAEWVVLMRNPDTEITTRLHCPKISEREDTLLMLSGIRITAIRENLEAQLRKKLEHKDTHSHTGPAKRQSIWTILGRAWKSLKIT